MNTKELMLGDIIYRCLDNGKKVRCSVKSISETRLLVHYLDEMEYFEPIPITPEILEKNGFRKEEKPPFGYIIGDYGFYWEDNSLTDGVLIRLIYVHELQHALRLCGLDDLADNFKV